MIVGYHVIFATYGFWPPNDPRGSWSSFVGSWDLAQHGRATKTSELKSLAHIQHDQAARLRAKSALKFPPVEFTGMQARAVGRGFAHYIEQCELPVWACAIMPDHVHMVIAKPAMRIEQLIIQLKSSATRELEREGIHPLQQWKKPQGRVPQCWVRGQWKVFLDADDVNPAIQYVENNPVKDGKKKQTWSFVSSPEDFTESDLH